MLQNSGVFRLRGSIERQLLGKDDEKEADDNTRCWMM